MYDAKGTTDLQIYNIAGKRVPRRERVINPHAPRCGILVNIRTAPQALATEITYDSEDEGNAADFQQRLPCVYPQAFTNEYGYLQSSSPVPAMVPIAADINAVLGRIATPPAPDNVSDEENDDYVEPCIQTGKPLTLGGFQLYSESVHTMSPSHGGHRIAHGCVTAATAGLWPPPRKHSRNQPP